MEDLAPSALAHALQENQRLLREIQMYYAPPMAKLPEGLFEATSPARILEQFQGEMENLAQEQFRVISLDQQLQVRIHRILYQGNVSSSMIRASEVFRDAVVHNLPAIVVIHNHPSGVPDPSPEDVAITKLIIEAGKLLGIRVTDHLIVGNPEHISLRQRSNELGITWDQ